MNKAKNGFYHQILVYRKASLQRQALAAPCLWILDMQKPRIYTLKLKSYRILHMFIQNHTLNPLN